MGLRMWRQMMKVLMRCVVNVDIDDDGDQEEDALDEIFGHTTGTGRSRYGLTWNDLPLLHEDMLSDLFRMSKRYWRWLDNPHTNFPLQQLEISYGDIHKTMSLMLGKLEQAALQQTLAITQNSAHSVKIIDMLQSANDKIDHTHQALLLAQGPAIQSSQSLLQDVGPLEIVLICIHGLRLYLKDSSASFKSTPQALAIEVISRGTPHALIVMPTGAGKTAIYTSPSYIEKSGFRLIIIPYRSLLDQVVQDACSRGLPHSVYPSQTVDIFRSRLIFVALEHCADNNFCTWCKAAKDVKLLRSIVIDEAHDILMAADYRYAFKKLLRLTDLNVQIILMTGTLSPRSEITLLQALQMDPLSVRRIQVPTHCPEIQYRVTQTDRETLDDNVLHAALSHVLQSHERSIIFVLTTTCCETLADLTGFPKYHGQLTHEERLQAMITWKSGKSQWIIGTLAMAQGIDVCHVCVVINRDISWVSSNAQGSRTEQVLSAIHFVQTGGRAGHDGKPCIHHLIYTTVPSVNANPSEDHLGEQTMVKFVSQNVCCRCTLSLFLDGIDHTCMSMLHAELCDVCVAGLHTVKYDQEFYSSPTGSRLKAPSMADPATPGHTLIPQYFQPVTVGLPTPISNRMQSFDVRQSAPETPTLLGQSDVDVSHQENRLSSKGKACLQACSAPLEDDLSSDDDSDGPHTVAFPRKFKPMRSERPTKRAREVDVSEEYEEEQHSAPSQSHKSSKRTASTTPARPWRRDPPSDEESDPPASHSTSSSKRVHLTHVQRLEPSVQAPTSSRNACNDSNDPWSTDVALGEGLPTTLAAKLNHIGQWCEMQVYSKLRSMFSTGHGYGSQLEDFVTVALFPILPLPYFIFSHKPTLKAVLSAMSINPKHFLNLEAFTAWLMQEDNNREALPNILELLIVYMNMKLDNVLDNVSSAWTP
ncbi:P-loop containing nucleoside triphosphate hydrolase protein [Suillus occidentalis]|nr:P-loop containing nucleoside triphosphate hydrolase protein [Suillus occidentalis]